MVWGFRVLFFFGRGLGAKYLFLGDTYPKRRSNSHDRKSAV